MSELLYTSADIHKAIGKLFRDSKKRRVAISAFVGIDAEAYLPSPENLELICWPKEGGTNPDALRSLTKRGAKIYFSDSLHMKVYWSENQGAIITSANLSNNALGSGNLKEFGVKLPPGTVDIDRIILSVNARPINPKDMQDLDSRHRKHISLYRGKNRVSGHIMSYHEWFMFPYRPAWKLGWYDSDGTVSKEAKKIAKDEYGVRSVNDFIAAKEKDYQEADFVLTFNIDTLTSSNIGWLYVSRFIKVPKSDKTAYNRDYPYEAVQFLSSRKYPAPPFKVNKQFLSAFTKAIDDFGISKIKEIETCDPPKRLLGLIEKYFLL